MCLEVTTALYKFTRASISCNFKHSWNISILKMVIFVFFTNKGETAYGSKTLKHTKKKLKLV